MMMRTEEKQEGEERDREKVKGKRDRGKDSKSSNPTGCVVYPCVAHREG